MPKYDFKSLSSYDFEVLCRDLLQEKLSIPIENFKTGQDQGIDLRYMSNEENFIIQCKHYSNSKYSNLKSSLKDEIKKIRILKPTRYIVVTSLGLTPLNKKEIMSILDPYVNLPSDIIDCENLNSLLNTYSNVESKHFKLWLTSKPLLDKIFNNSLLNYSDIKKQEIMQKIKLYVQCDSFHEALNILEKNNYCIISGEPGIGKSTLADILSYYFIDKGLNFYEVSNMDDVHNVYHSEEKLVILIKKKVVKFLVDLIFQNNSLLYLFDFSGMRLELLLETCSYAQLNIAIKILKF